MCECVKRKRCDKGHVVLPNGTTFFFTDPCIRNVIQAIVNAGFTVTASCCGHNVAQPSICLGMHHTLQEFDQIVAIVNVLGDGRVWEVKMWEPTKVIPSAIPKEDRVQCEDVDIAKEELLRLNQSFELNKLTQSEIATHNRCNREGSSGSPNREGRK